MIAELFSMLSTVDVSNKGGKPRLAVNLNRNRIRSISAFSSNAIFYFKTIVTDQATPEEVAMVSRLLEQSYASFVVACIGLMPFHRVKADDQAAIESYLQQFHQNLGINSGSAATMTKVFALADSISESVTEEDLAVTRDFLMECWDKSRKNCSRYVNMVADHLQSVNEMYSVDPIDPVTRVFQEAYVKRLDELDTWGFIGEATGSILNNFDDVESMTDADIIQSMYADVDYDDDDIDDEELSDDELDQLLGESAKGLSLDELTKARAELKQRWETEHPGVPMRRGINRAYLTEGNVKGAVNSIIFSLESVSENKIKSCQSLVKLRTLESKLNKLKNKYAKYLDRYKKKYKENQSKKTKSKLSIRFNGETISNPKAFMKQFGGYIKIINKRLKMVEKRREELRKQKGLPAGDLDPKLEESAIGVLNSIDFDVLDRLIEQADAQLNAPDSEVFIEAKVVLGPHSKGYLESPNPKRPYASDSGSVAEERRFVRDQERVDTLVGLARENQELTAKLQSAGVDAKDLKTITAKNQELQRQVNQMTLDGKSRDQQVEKMSASYKEHEKRMQEMEKSFGKENARNLAQLGIYASTQRELQRQIADLEKENAKLKGTSGPDPDFSVGDAGIDINWNKSKPANGINLGKVAANGQTNFQTFDGNKVFTDMEMKKANDAIPTFAKATIGFVIDETEQVVNRDVLVGVKVHINRVSAMSMVNEIYNCIINKRQFLKFVKWISGEEKSLADLLFGFKELQLDAKNSRNGGAQQWGAAFRRRKRLKDMSVPYLMKNYTPNGTVVITMNELQYIKDEYGLDIMRPDHIKMLMESSFLLGFVILDQANEMIYVSYDGENGQLQQYTYAMAERAQVTSDRAMRELYRSFSR